MWGFGMCKIARVRNLFQTRGDGKPNQLFSTPVPFSATTLYIVKNLIEHDHGFEQLPNVRPSIAIAHFREHDSLNLETTESLLSLERWMERQQNYDGPDCLVSLTCYLSFWSLALAVFCTAVVFISRSLLGDPLEQAQRVFATALCQTAIPEIRGEPHEDISREQPFLPANPANF